MIKTITNLTSKIQRQLVKFNFAKKKKGGEQKDQYEQKLKSDKDFEVPEDEIGSSTVRDIDDDVGDKTVSIDAQFNLRSAQLYDKYVITQQRPQITSDLYQINFSLIIQRNPIHIPYDKRDFEFYRDRLHYTQLAGYYNAAPENFVENESTHINYDTDKVSPQNIITHRQGDFVYAENSKHWRLASSQISDLTSIQNNSTSTVFLIVKNKEGKWAFPERTIIQKENFDEFKKNLMMQITGNPEYRIHWMTGKPIFAHRQQTQGLERGIGIKTFYYNAIHMYGLLDKSNEKIAYQQHLWVPKYELSKYFQKSYFDRTIGLIMTNL